MGKKNKNKTKKQKTNKTKMPKQSKIKQKNTQYYHEIHFLFGQITLETRPTLKTASYTQ